MAKLIPTLIVFLCFTALLSSSDARSSVTSPEDVAANLPPATFIEEDVSDLKSVIALPTDNLKPTNRRFERLRAFRCRHGQRSDGGDQIRPFWREDGDEEHHHHGEGEGRMIGEFKQPDFFFGRHRHHHHHHDGDFQPGGEEHEEREHHHRHRRGHGFWKAIRKMMGPF